MVAAAEDRTDDFKPEIYRVRKPIQQSLGEPDENTEKSLPVTQNFV